MPLLLTAMPPPFYLCFATSVPVTRTPHVFCLSTVNQFTRQPAIASPLRRAHLHHAAAASRVPRATAAAATTVSNNSENKNNNNANPAGFNNNGATDPDDVPPVVTAQVTNSALGTLLSYISELSKQQPFIRRRLILSLICILASKLIGVTVPFFFKQAVDALMLASSSSGVAAATSKATRAATVAIVLHGVTRLFASITHELRSVVFAKGGQRVGRSATATAFAHLHSLEVAFHAGSRTGAVTRVIDRGTRAIMTIFRAMVFSFFPSFFELVLVCTVLFTKFSAAYAAVTLLTFAAFTTWTLSINNTMSLIRQRLNSAENEASAKLTDSLINIEAVKVYDNARHETKRYDKSLEKFEAISIQNEKLFASLNIGQTAAYTVGLTALLLLATTDIAAGRITVGSVVLLTTMIQRLWIPLDFLGWQYREVKQSIIDVQNLFDILRREPAVKDRADTTPLIVTEGHIDFQNVCFSYPAGDAALPFASKKAQPVKQEPQRDAMKANGKDKHFNNGVASAKGNGTNHAQSHSPAKRTRRRVAIDNLSFSVPGGTSVALVGASGSGKSTATRLLCRLYDVTGGRILIDGQDIASTSLSSLRNAVSIVPQVSEKTDPQPRLA